VDRLALPEEIGELLVRRLLRAQPLKSRRLRARTVGDFDASGKKTPKLIYIQRYADIEVFGDGLSPCLILDRWRTLNRDFLPENIPDFFDFELPIDAINQNALNRQFLSIQDLKHASRLWYSPIISLFK
jgi:hypothetical protein